MTFPLEVFVGTVQAAARCDQSYLLRVMSHALRVLFVIAAMRAGGRLFGLGAAMLVPNLLYYCGHIPLAFRAMPSMSVHPRWFRKNMLADMFRYGWVSFSVATNEKLRDYIYPVIIAKFLSPAAVTLFSLPVKLLAFPVQGISTMTEVINPLSSQLEAHNDFPTLRRLIQLTVQSAFLMLVPMAAFFIVFGKNLLTLWAGPQYSSGYPLLVLLTLGMGTAATQCCVQSMLFGIERHRGMVWFRFIEGVTIAILGSIALRVSGLGALALVSALVQLIVNVVLIPRHLCRILDLSLTTYLVEACLKPCSLALPLLALLMPIRSALQIETWPMLLVALIVTAVLFAVLVSFVMFSSMSNASWSSLEVLNVIGARMKIQWMKPCKVIVENL
jgi:O-antigen/teichoic acid export membrane protein